jgi:hypothetical protein
MDFATRAIAPGRTIVEFAPYADLRAMQREPRDLAARTIAGGEWKIRVLGIRQDTAQVPAGTFPVLCIDVEGSAGGGAHALQNSLPSNIHALSRFRHTGCYAHAVGRYVTARHSQWDVHGRKVTDDLVSLERFEAAN